MMADNDYTDLIKQGKIIVNQYAKTMAEALSEYCKKHEYCEDCVFLREKEKDNFGGVSCMFRQTTPRQWFGGKI